MNGGWPAAGAALAIAVGVAVAAVALYLQHRRGLPQVVPSLVIWQRLGRTPGAAKIRVRWWLSLAAALSVCVLVGAAIVPDLSSFDDGTAKSRIVVIDTSPSMHARTRDGGTRVERAVLLATQAVRAFPRGVRVALLDTTGQLPLRGELSRDEALSALARFESVPVARTPELPNVRLRTSSPARALLFTDGVASLAPDAGVEVGNVFEPADNVGIASLEVRTAPDSRSRLDAVVRVANGSQRTQLVDVVLESGSARIGRRITVPAGTVVSEGWDVSALPPGVLVASVSAAGDALTRDDRAFAILPDLSPIPVLLVSRGNANLHKALELLPGVIVRTADPATYERDGPGEAAVVVLDAIEPAVPPPVPVLAFGSPALAARGDWIDPARPERAGGHDALTTALAWGDVRIDRAPRWSLGAGTIVRAGSDRTVTLVGESAHAPRRLDVAFRLEDSNLALQGRFPAFLGAALDRLRPAAHKDSHPPGTIVVSPDVLRVRSRDSGAEVVLFSTPSGPAFRADAPGVFAVERPGERTLLVVNAGEPSVSFVNRTRLPFDAVSRPEANPGGGIDVRWRLFFLSIAACLLIAETLAFTRRLTE